MRHASPIIHPAKTDVNPACTIVTSHSGRREVEVKVLNEQDTILVNAPYSNG